jgi:hypothetical protein
MGKTVIAIIIGIVLSISGILIVSNVTATEDHEVLIEEDIPEPPWSGSHWEREKGKAKEREFSRDNGNPCLRPFYYKVSRGQDCSQWANEMVVKDKNGFYRIATDEEYESGNTQRVDSVWLCITDYKNSPDTCPRPMKRRFVSQTGYECICETVAIDCLAAKPKCPAGFFEPEQKADGSYTCTNKNWMANPCGNHTNLGSAMYGYCCATLE